MIRSIFTVKYIELEGGFWGLIDDHGNQYLPLNLPEQLKLNGQTATLSIETLDVMGSMMWGAPVNIVSFTTS